MTPENQGWRPEIATELRQLCQSQGIMQATHTVLEQSNITVVPEGPLKAIVDHTDGLLFAGNHSMIFEFAILTDMLSQLGKTSIKHVAKFYAEEQTVWLLGEQAREMTLPVYPRALASDRKNKINAELPLRLVFHRHLKSLEESKKLTDNSLQAAADELALGGIVNIYPRGSVRNDVRRTWRAGIGRIIQKLPEDAQEKTMYVPYHVDGLNPVKIVAAVASRGKGILGRPQRIGISVGEPRPIDDMVKILPPDARHDPLAVAEVLRRHYVSTLLP